jgi:WD40 repeat protein
LARAGGDYNRSLLLAAQAVNLNPSPATESDLFATLLRGDAVLATLHVPTSHNRDLVQDATFSPDGRSVFGVDFAGELLRWPSRGGPAKVLRVGPYTDQVATASDGRLVVGFYSTRVRGMSVGVLDPRDGRMLAQVPEASQGGWALSADRRDVIYAPHAQNGPASAVSVWRLGTPVRTIRRVPVGAPVLRIASCGAATACVLTEDRQLTRVRLSDATVERRLTLPPDTLDNFAATSDGRLLATGQPDGILRLIDARTGRVVRQLAGASRDLRPLAFSPDGSRVAAGDADTLLVWRTDRTELPERHDVFGGRVLFAAFTADGSTIASGGYGRTVVVLDATGRRHVGAVLTRALGEDTSTLWPTRSAIVVGQVSGPILFVDPSTGVIHRAEGDTGGGNLIDTARAAPAGKLLVTVWLGGLTAVWDLKTRRLLGTVDLPADQPPYSPGAWVSPDGSQAATIRPAGPVVFDLATRKVLRQLRPLPPPEAQVDERVDGWTPDGRSLLITRQLTDLGDSDLLVVDATTGAVKLHVPTGNASAEEATADPTGRYLALAVGDGTLRVIDAKDGHPLAPPLRANEGEVLNVSISPDGRYISASGEPPRVTIWDTRTFRQVGDPLPLDVNALDARARFAPDGRLIVTSGTVLRAFTIDPAKWLARACQEAGRTLTRAEFEEVLPGRSYAPACT